MSGSGPAGSGAVRVSLIGLQGFGRVHLAEIDRLAGLGKVRLVSCADTAAPNAAAGEVLGRHRPAIFGDYRVLLEQTRPEVLVIAAPPHLHHEMAVAGLHAGCNLLLEKPPVVSCEQLDSLESLLRTGALVCQVGFQSLGSGALDRLAALRGSGALGEPSEVFAVGRWRRDRAYWSRSPWAGRDQLDGRFVHDGALTNPFAHAVMNCLAVLGVERIEGYDVEVERYRANPIEVDDTAVLRLRGSAGQATVAVTLCAEAIAEPRCVLVGTAGEARWRYPGDALELARAGEPAVEERHQRRSLLEELVDLVAGRSITLSCPLGRTRPFVEALDRIAATPVRELASRQVRWQGQGAAAFPVVAGVDDLVERAAREGRLLSELGLEAAGGTTPRSRPPTS